MDGNKSIDHETHSDEISIIKTVNKDNRFFYYLINDLLIKRTNTKYSNYETGMFDERYLF